MFQRMHMQAVDAGLEAIGEQAEEAREGFVNGQGLEVVGDRLADWAQGLQLEFVAAASGNVERHVDPFDIAEGFSLEIGVAGDENHLVGADFSAGELVAVERNFAVEDEHQVVVLGEGQREDFTLVV